MGSASSALPAAGAATAALLRAAMSASVPCVIVNQASSGPTLCSTTLRSTLVPKKQWGKSSCGSSQHVSGICWYDESGGS